MPGGSTNPRELKLCPVCSAPLEVGWLVNGPGFWADERTRWNKRVLGLLRNKTYKPAARCGSCRLLLTSLDPDLGRW
jgi:hypothetical protein